MKKLFTLLFAVGLVAAASAQPGDRYRNDGRNNSYQSSPYSNNQYRNSQWNNRGYNNRYESRRQRAERLRYEMMMRRNRARYHNRVRHESYVVPYRQPVFQLSIGIGGRR